MTNREGPVASHDAVAAQEIARDAALIVLPERDERSSRCSRCAFAPAELGAAIRRVPLCNSCRRTAGHCELALLAAGAALAQLCTADMDLLRFASLARRGGQYATVQTAALLLARALDDKRAADTLAALVAHTAGAPAWPRVVAIEEDCEETEAASEFLDR